MVRLALKLKFNCNIDIYIRICSLFNFTKEEWTKINASGAYEAIIKGIYEAKTNVKMTQEILENVTRIIDPENVDNLMVKTNLAHAYSDRLKQRINNFKDISKGKIKSDLFT